ncbi:MAG: Flp family type IVb pilin [Jatrophihabitans sp.]|nr:MAG: Flp family type IVb pilin [Jatrophihabitans sp.]
MNKLMAFLVAFQVKAAELAERKDRGATATEYALLVALIALVIFAAVWFFGSELSDFFTKIGDTVQGWI